MRLRKSGRVIAGFALIGIVTACAMLAPIIARHNPDSRDLLETLLPPAWMAGGKLAFLFGSDEQGRDVLSRLLFGARMAVEVAFLASVGAALLGGVAAVAAGYFGGWADWLIARTAGAFLVPPRAIFVTILMYAQGAGERHVIFAIVLADWARFCRSLRDEALAVGAREHIVVARMLGISKWRILTREVMPPVAPLLLTMFTLEMAIAVASDALLSVLGLGANVSQIAWGRMIGDGRTLIQHAPWTVIAPMAAIFAAVAGFNLLGDGLRRGLAVRSVEAEP